MPTILDLLSEYEKRATPGPWVVDPSPRAIQTRVSASTRIIPTIPEASFARQWNRTMRLATPPSSPSSATTPLIYWLWRERRRTPHTFRRCKQAWTHSAPSSQMHRRMGRDRKSALALAR